MKLVKRYRKVMTTRALKQPGPLYVLDRDEVDEAVRGGAW